MLLDLSHVALGTAREFTLRMRNANSFIDSVMISLMNRKDRKIHKES
jgi:hypothetical protein